MIDLIFPVIVLVICCIIGMIYTGGFFSGTSFIESFSQSDASVALSIGSLIALIITVIFYSVEESWYSVPVWNVYRKDLKLWSRRS